MLKSYHRLLLIAAILFAVSFNALADTSTTTAGTKPFFEPIVEIILDKTGTMQVGPMGTTNSRYGKNADCSGSSSDFSDEQSSPYNYDCSRVAIAQRVIFNILDHNGDGYLTDDDKDAWKLKIGAMIYYWKYVDSKPTTTLNYYKQVGDVTDSYQYIMCGSNNDEQPCTLAQINLSTESALYAGCHNGEETKLNMCLADKTTGGGTNTTQALGHAKTYLDGFSTGDDACRNKYVILITDGTDNKAYHDSNSNCVTGGSGYDCAYPKDTIIFRREMILKVRELAEAGYKVFVVGFAKGLQEYHTDTLNWMGLWGNPKVSETDYPDAEITPSGIKAKRTDPSIACDYKDLSSGLLPTDKSHECVTQGDPDVTSLVSGFFAPTNDPGYMKFSKFKKDYSVGDAAYFSSDPTALANDLKGILGAIFSENYSFTQASLQAVRDADESFLYEASFESSLNDPFYIGHLKRFAIDYTTGDIAISNDGWDAGAVLQSATGSSRKMYTFKGGSQVEFNTTNVTYTDLAVSDATEAGNVINFVRSGELVTSYEKYGWKLGDISRSSPLTIGTPNALFYDKWDSATTATDKAFYKYRLNHVRKSSTGTRLILLGANDGQMHLFKTGELAAEGGSEVWSFIPPNFLPLLKKVAHIVHPPSPVTSGVTLSHTLFVDGPTSAAEIWLGSGSLCSSATTCGIAKTETDWHTYFILSEGMGGTDSLWSSSLSCDSGFNPTYSSTYNNFCGYWAFDISGTTTTTNNTGVPPVFKWRVGWKSGETTNSLTSSEGPYLGIPYNKMFIGRVRENNQEKWVGLLGGGYSGEQYKASGYNTRGKGIFVIDMNDGHVFWKKTVADVSAMVWDIASPVAGIDTDNDGFLDVAYAGDANGNVWRVKFCKAADDSYASPCTTSKWSISKFYDDTSNSGIRPIYTSVSAAKDNTGQIWVYFGTGDKIDPNDSSSQERFYAVKDDLSKTVSGTGTLDQLSESDVSSTYDINSTSKPDGWYIEFGGSGQKLIADPLVFNGVVYFTVFTPRKTGDACDEAGSSDIYGLDYMTGAGMLTDTSGNIVKGKTVGDGLATGVSVSRGPDGSWNLYAFKTVGDPHTTNVPGVPSSDAANNSIIYWKDRRVK